MLRRTFLNTIALAGTMNTLQRFQKFSETLPIQERTMPVIFTSHGNPMDIPVTREQRPFWNTLFGLGKDLQSHYEIKAALIVSAHWCTRGTFVNISPEQEQIYD